LAWAPDGGELSTSRPSRFISGEGAPGACWTGGWVKPRARLDVVEQIQITCPCRESNPGRPARSSSLYYLNTKFDEKLATLLKTKTILKPYIIIGRFNRKDGKDGIR
jgi:hypothetical protein